jgi:hypothetical protein
VAIHLGYRKDRWMSDVASLGSRVAALLAMTGLKTRPGLLGELASPHVGSGKEPPAAPVFGGEMQRRASANIVQPQRPFTGLVGGAARVLHGADEASQAAAGHHPRKKPGGQPTESSSRCRAA